MNSLKGEALVDQIKTKSMGDDQIKLYLPDARIMTYKELSNYQTIEELLPESKSYIILLYEVQPNNGHWVGLMRYDFNDTPTIEYNDAYGKPVDNPLKWIPKLNRIQLGEDKPLLTDLLNKTELKVVHNNKQYQDDDPDIADCGRWAILRILAMKEENMDLKTYQHWIHKLKKDSGYSYDQIVSAFINNVDAKTANFLNKNLSEHR